MRVDAKAPAKLNLSLDITGRRDDGYHLLQMVTQSVDLCDTVSVSDDADDDDGIRIICDDSLPQGSENSAYKAAEAFFEHTEIEPSPITIRIKKRIPVSAGLGGGSADAAAVIVALDELFNTRLDNDELCEIGAKVGADVPVCIVGGTALAEGTGGLINPLPNIPECWFVLVNPGQKTSTKDMYDRYDKEGKRAEINTQDIIDAICLGDLEEIGKNMGNVFENLWDKDTRDEIKEIMNDCDMVGMTLSGSGPTYIGMFESRGDANDCASQLRKNWDDVIICQPDSDGAVIDD